jgi:hypothetical protein
MASNLVTALSGKSSDKSSDGYKHPIAKYVIDVKDNEDGVPMLRLLVKRADGSGSKFQNLILWLDEPGSARALAAILPQLAKSLAYIDDMQVKAKHWPAATPEAPEQPATPAAAPKKSALEEAFANVPF